MSKSLFKYLPYLGIVLLSVLYQYRHLTEFPAYIHAWAQADHYALALGFIHNDLNFFEPQTYQYNKQFPHFWEHPHDETITSVDFPIHNYLVAICMKLSGNHEPTPFHLYIFLYSLLGLFFLHRLALALTKNKVLASFVTLFAMTSPVFVYYQSGFLPSIPSLANTVIGLEYYHRHLQNNKTRHFTLSIAFLTLAALARTTFAIPLIGLLGIEFIRLIQKNTRLYPKIVPVVLSVGLLVFYQLYNAHLRNLHGSIFLHYFLPASNMQAFVNHLRASIDALGTDYFSIVHYFSLVLAGLFITLPRFRKKSLANTYYTGLFLVAYFTGCIIFLILMARQLSIHDYYFLDTLYLPFVLLLAYLLSFVNIPKNRWVKITMLILLSALSVGFIQRPFQTQKERHTHNPWDKTDDLIRNYSSAGTLLDTLHIAPNARMLVLGANAPNIPFILMRRKGYVVMTVNEENIKRALNWDYDYLVTENQEFEAHIYRYYPNIRSRLDTVGHNDRITVCTVQTE